MCSEFEYVKRILKGTLILEGADPKKCEQDTAGFKLAKNQQGFIGSILKKYSEWWGKDGEELFKEKKEMIELIHANPDKDTTQVWERVDEIEGIVEAKIKEFFKGEYDIK
ncbi:MAG: hypothetical protein GOU97_01315 [Nanoarchaeota archaeon]|nr:hypothetical protein [Nanoarchaeota archaeon]